MELPDVPAIQIQHHPFFSYSFFAFSIRFLCLATMLLYKCRFSGDEMCSDAFKPVPVKDDDGNEVEGLFQIESEKVNKVR